MNPISGMNKSFIVSDGTNECAHHDSSVRPAKICDLFLNMILVVEVPTGVDESRHVELCKAMSVPLEANTGMIGSSNLCGALPAAPATARVFTEKASRLSSEGLLNMPALDSGGFQKGLVIKMRRVLYFA